MKFELSDDLMLFQKTMNRFANQELAPDAALWDEREEPSWEKIKKLGQANLLGLTIPEEYGGMGAGMLSFVIALEEIAKVDASSAGVMLIHSGVASRAIWALGSDEIKAKYLPALASGEKLAAYAQTEPEAGSDASAMRTRADLQGDHYVLNGTKCFISNGGTAEIFTVLAKTDPQERSRGISAFVVEKGMEGFSVGKVEKKMGLRAHSTAELIFDNCRVPKENLLAEAPTAFKRLMTLFNGERVGNATICLGIAAGALEKAMLYAKHRMAFGQTIGQFQGIRWMLADMATQVDAARLLICRAAYLIDQGLPFIKEASMAKLYANEMVKKVTDLALQIHGGYGYMREYEVERMVRDARFGSVAGGTTEIQRNVIAAQMLDDKG